MDDFYWRRKNTIPPFGCWYSDDKLSFTQSFEQASRPGSGWIRRGYLENADLCLYENGRIAPAVILVPRGRLQGCYPDEKEVKRQRCAAPAPAPAMCDCECKKLKSNTELSHGKRRVAPKAVDEDLYKISPHLILKTQTKRKRANWFIFSSCLHPRCIL